MLHVRCYNAVWLLKALLLARGQAPGLCGEIRPGSTLLLHVCCPLQLQVAKLATVDIAWDARIGWMDMVPLPNLHFIVAINA